MKTKLTSSRKIDPIKNYKTYILEAKSRKTSKTILMNQYKNQIYKIALEIIKGINN